MPLLQLKHLWRTLMLTVAMVFALSPLYAQSVSIDAISAPNEPNPTAPTVCTGRDFYVEFAYSYSNFPSGTGPQEIEIIIPIPAGLILPANNALGAINPIYGTVTPVPTGTPTSLRYNITADLSLPSGGGTVGINLRFPTGTTCNNTEICFTATSKYKLNNVWSSPISTPNKIFCVKAEAHNNWTVKKDVMWCKWDTTGRSILYRLMVQNNTSSNNWDPNCSINMNTYSLTDVIPTGASFGGIDPAPAGFTPSSWSAASTLGNTITFSGSGTGIGGPASLNVANSYYYVYFWVNYPNTTFSGVQSVLNRVNLGNFDACDNIVRLSDSVRANLCNYVNAGALTKYFTQIIGTPPNGAYFPSISPGCCGSYTLAYRNAGTVDQPNLVTVDNIPDNVDFTGVRTVITQAGMTCQVEYYDITTPFPHWNALGTLLSTVGTHISPSIPATASKVRWTYGGTALPVGYTLSNYIAFCVRNNYRIPGNSQLTDANLNGVVDPGEHIINTATTSQNNVQLAYISDDQIVSPIAPKIVAHKMFIGTCTNGNASTFGPWYPGGTVRYRMAIANIGNTPATTCTITDLLPQYLSYVGNPTYAWYTATSIPGVNNNIPACNITSTNPPTAAVGTINPPTQSVVGNQQQLAWNFTSLPNDCDGFPTYLIIDFDVKISNAPNPIALAGQYCNTYTFTASNYMVDPATQQPKKSNQVCFNVMADPQFIGTKEVRNLPSGNWGMAAPVGAGQQGEYRIKIKNTGNTPLLRLSLLDILPHVGDKSILRYPYNGNFNNRNSQYGITLSGPVTPTGGSTLTTGQITSTYFSNYEPFKRSTVGLGFPSFGSTIADPTGAVSTLQTLSTGAKAFVVEANSGILFMPGQNLEFTVAFTVDPLAPDDSVACNSFAYQARPGGLPSYVGNPIKAEAPPVCVTAINPPPSDGSDCCDSALIVPYAHQDVNEDARTVTIINKKNTPIAWIGIEYYKNCGTVASSTSLQYPVSLNLGGLKATWNGFATPYPYPGSWFNITDKHYAPKVPNSLCTAPPGYTGSPYQDKIMFNVGMSAYDPDTWCIKLVVHHCDSSICTIDLPVFDPDTAATSSTGVTVTPGTGTVRWVTITLDGRQFKGENVRYILLTPQDSLDKIAGGSGGLFESADDLDAKAAVTSFNQSPHSALFGLRPDSLNGSLNVFIQTQDPKKKPIIKWTIFNGSGKPLSKGTVEASSTVSIVNPPTIAPGTNDVAINSIIPNPASGSVMFNYTLGASEAVRIELFDPLGKSVGVIADGFQTQGLHQLNYHVGTLAEGTYYLRLTTRFGRASAVVKVIH